MNEKYGKLVLRRGLKKDLPTRLPEGEAVFCIDTYEFVIGTDAGYVIFKPTEIIEN